MVKQKKWARNSILGLLKSSTAALAMSNKGEIKRDRRSSTKHTFFPGNEILGNRLSSVSEFIIDSDSIAKAAWDVLVMLITIYLSYVIPYSISFYSDVNANLWHCVGVIYLLDILLNLNTAYITRGMRVYSRKRIIKHYLSTWLIFDLIISFPYEFMFLEQLNYSITHPNAFDIQSKDKLRLLLVIKLFRLVKYKRVMFNLQDLFPGHFVYNLTSIFTYLVFVSLLLHVTACVFNIVYCMNLLEIYENPLQLFSDSFTRYLHFLLLSTETMTSVGYGEFRINTDEENIFAMLAMVMTSGLLGYIVGGVSAALKKSYQLSYYFRDIHRKTTVYCNINNIDKQLKDRVMSFMRNLKYLYSTNLVKEEDFLNLLSSPLKEEIFSYIRGDTLLRLHKFRQLSTQCQRMIGHALKLEIFGPSDLIIKQDQLTDEVYFIIGGHVEVFHQYTSTAFRLLSKPEYFGEIGFFFGTRRTASLKSEGFSELLKLNKFDFEKILRTMPKDKEKIDVMQRNFKNYGLATADVHCYLCNKLGHVASGCDLYIFNKGDFSLLNYSRKIRPNTNLKREDKSNKDHEFFSRYNIQTRKGKEMEPKDIFKHNASLAREARMYTESVDGFFRRNSKMLSMISGSEIIEEESCSSNGSDSSRENFLSFRLSRSGLFDSRCSVDSQVSSNRSIGN